MSRDGQYRGMLERMKRNNSPDYGTFHQVGSKDFDVAHWQAWAAWTIGRPHASMAVVEAAQKYLREHPLREPGDDQDEAA